jgi:TetR/AcrR family transcriptional regulator, tetracycline repressor protein
MTETTAGGPDPVDLPGLDRPPLSRELVIAAALEHLDSEGIASLTMRGLGRRLGVEAMSLYRYVNGREDLLEGIVAQLMEQLEADPGDRLYPEDGWQAYLHWLAHEVRRTALAHPAAFPLVATRHPAAPWLRPPLRSLRLVEQFLEALVRRGFSDEQAVEAYRAFTTFLLGHLLLETASQRVADSGTDEPLDEGEASVPGRDRAARPGDFPALQRLRPLLSQDHTDDEFERALEALLDRMDRVVSR